MEVLGREVGDFRQIFVTSGSVSEAHLCLKTSDLISKKALPSELVKNAE